VRRLPSAALWIGRSSSPQDQKSSTFTAAHRRGLEGSNPARSASHSADGRTSRSARQEIAAVRPVSASRRAPENRQACTCTISSFSLLAAELGPLKCVADRSVQ
jgi:hypothetical protein